METLLHSAKFDVIRRSVSDRDGRARDMDFIRHPGAVVLLPLLPDGRILLLHQYRPSIERTLQELPAGTLDRLGEPPTEAAARELEEETGHRAARLELLCRFYPSPGILTEMIWAYVASDLTRTVARPEPNERIEVEPVTLDEALRRIGEGNIMDAKSIVTLLFFTRSAAAPPRQPSPERPA